MGEAGAAGPWAYFGLSFGGFGAPTIATTVPTYQPSRRGRSAAAAAVGTGQRGANPATFQCHGDTGTARCSCGLRSPYSLPGIGGAARCWLRPRRPAARSYGFKVVFANGFSVRAGDFYLKPSATNMLHSGECFMSSVGGESVSQKSLVPSFGNNGVGHGDSFRVDVTDCVRYGKDELLD